MFPLICVGQPRSTVGNYWIQRLFAGMGRTP